MRAPPDPDPGAVPPRGRGTGLDPKNRFASTHRDRGSAWVDPDPDHEPGVARVETEYVPDRSKSVIATNDSPDIPFGASVNPYRGCEHGCVYCYARPFHEYLGWSAGLDFETRILVKHDAPRLLEKALRSPTYRPQPLAMSGATDAYQPVERRLEITRACLAVLARFRNPVMVVTKSQLVERDADLLAELARHDAASAAISITTLDPGLARRMEPRAPTPAQRLETIRRLAESGVPTSVMVAPVVPGLTDHEVPSILGAARDAGASGAGYVMLRLPLAVEALFRDFLDRVAPLRKDRVLARLRDVRNGRLSDARPGLRMRGEGPQADWLAHLFAQTCRRVGLSRERPALSTAAFRRPGAQLPLFDA